MSLDARGRAATASLRRVTTQEVDAMTMLDELHRSDDARRTRSRTALAVAAVLVAALAVAGVLAFRGGGTDHAVPPVTTPTPVACPSGPFGTVECLPGNAFHVKLTVPVTFTMPADFNPENVFLPGNGTHAVEVYRDDVDGTGVTVLEGATPVRNDTSDTRDPAAGTTAQSVATWLAHRPYAVPTTVTTTTVDGHPAWSVQVVLKPGAPLLGMHGPDKAAPAFVGPATNLGQWSNMKARYTLLDLPGAGLTVIWSWSFTDDVTTLDASQPMVDALRFG